MNVAIVGGTGFVGKNLAERFVRKTSHHITVISRNATNHGKTHDTDRVRYIDADVFDEEQMGEALQGATVAYFFVHMMGQKNKDFVTQEALAAHRFCAAAKAADIKRVIYMGGLGDDHETLSPHLLSRHATGTILRENLPLVIEFRASMIIGDGSLAFDIIRNLVHKLPIMTLPRWSTTKTQPIALDDALSYLSQAATVAIEHSEIIEIGGPDVVSYMELYKRYAQWKGRRLFVVRLPYLPEWLGGWWLNLFTPRYHAKVGRVMVHSMGNAMVVTHDRAKTLFPTIKPVTITQSFDAVKTPQ